MEERRGPQCGLRGRTDRWALAQLSERFRAAGDRSRANVSATAEAIFLRPLLRGRRLWIVLAGRPLVRIRGQRKDGLSLAERRDTEIETREQQEADGDPSNCALPDHLLQRITFSFRTRMNVIRP